MAVSVTSWTDLDAMRNDLTEDYVLTKDLSSADDDYSGIGDDWTPIGDDVDYFEGSFDGGNHSIKDLVIDTSVSKDIIFVGLFGYAANGAVLKNVGLIDIDYDAYHTDTFIRIGGLVGYCACDIDNVHVTGSILADNSGAGIAIGGVAGYSMLISTVASSNTITISNSSADVSISNTDSGSSIYIGGLIGFVRSYEYIKTLTVENCSATGNVAMGYGDYGYVYVGGCLGYVGDYLQGQIYVKKCFSTGNVSLTDWHYTGRDTSLGGFSAIFYPYANGGTAIVEVEDCYSTGNVTYNNSTTRNLWLGGFTGWSQAYRVTNTATLNIDRCYATGDVIVIDNTTDNPMRGGFVGHMRELYGPVNLSDCYCTGNVDATNYGTGNYRCGRFMGWRERTIGISNCGIWTGADPTYDIGSPASNFDVGEGSANRTATKSDFYDIDHGTMYDNWDIVLIANHDADTNVWFIDDGNDYPHLWFELWAHKFLGVANANISKIMGVAKADMSKIIET